MPSVSKLLHPGSCTGMYWLADPWPDAVKAKQVGGGDWARNGSILVGVEHNVDDTKYLEVSAWKQSGAAALTEGCVGLWMPFEQGTAAPCRDSLRSLVMYWFYVSVVVWPHTPNHSWTTLAI